MGLTTPTMKLNHMSFPTTDVAATAGFFEKYLGFTIAQKFESKFYVLKRPGFDVVIEKAADDAPTAIALASNKSRSATSMADCIGHDAKWPKAFHVGFELPTVEDVRALRDRLKADGFETETDIFNPERGSRFFCRAPGGVLLEMNTRADASEKYRGTFDN
ncbi:MAG TPA: VOC family protein [Rhodopila sp.]|nr:VOC family protein [Rhodopila sp.]